MSCGGLPNGVLLRKLPSRGWSPDAPGSLSSASSLRDRSDRDGPRVWRQCLRASACKRARRFLRRRRADKAESIVLDLVDLPCARLYKVSASSCDRVTRGEVLDGGWTGPGLAVRAGEMKGSKNAFRPFAARGDNQGMCKQCILLSGVRIGDLQGDYDHSEARIASRLRKTGRHSSKIGCRVVSLHRGPGTRPALLEILQIGTSRRRGSGYCSRRYWRS